MNGGDDSRTSMDDVLASIRKIMQGGRADLSGVPEAGSKAGGGARSEQADEYALPPGAVTDEEKELASIIAARGVPDNSNAEAPGGDSMGSAAADDAAAADAVTDDGTADDGKADDGAVGDGTADDGGSVDDGAVDDGTADDGGHHGSTEALAEEDNKDDAADEPALELSDLIAAPSEPEASAEPGPEPAQPRKRGLASRLAVAASRVFAGHTAPADQPEAKPDEAKSTSDQPDYDEEEDVLTLGPAMQAPEPPSETRSPAGVTAETDAETAPAGPVAAALSGIGAADLETAGETARETPMGTTRNGASAVDQGPGETDAGDGFPSYPDPELDADDSERDIEIGTEPQADTGPGGTEASDADDPFADFVRTEDDEDDIPPPPPRRSAQFGAATISGKFALSAGWHQGDESEVEDAETVDAALSGPDTTADFADVSGEAPSGEAATGEEDPQEPQADDAEEAAGPDSGAPDTGAPDTDASDSDAQDSGAPATDDAATGTDGEATAATAKTPAARDRDNDDPVAGPGTSPETGPDTGADSADDDVEDATGEAAAGDVAADDSGSDDAEDSAADSIADSIAKAIAQAAESPAEAPDEAPGEPAASPDVAEAIAAATVSQDSAIAGGDKTEAEAPGLGAPDTPAVGDGDSATAPETDPSGSAEPDALEPAAEEIASEEPAAEDAAATELDEDTAGETAEEPGAEEVASAEPDAPAEDTSAPSAAADIGELEPVIRRIIREELEGEIGNNLSQSIRRLIREEIAHATLRNR